jgi:crotonobetainyl-CoA:carnitine CoA-transferase CaiB-like acyl-CoA transferase
MGNTATAPHALDGLRVVDCSRGTAGPRATQILADYGAEVLWVEPPGGDPYRDQLAIEYSVTLRNKASLELDLRTDAGREELRSLLPLADVLVTSWRPGVAERLGLARDAIAPIAPQLVTCAITGFGLDGPYRDVPGHEALVHSIVGTTGEQIGMRPAPIFEGMPFAALGAGQLAAVGILAALYRRGIDGAGRHVDTSMYDGALAYLTMLWGESDAGGSMHTPGRARMVVRSFLCADGEYLGVHTGAVGAFKRLVQLLGLEQRLRAGATPQEMGIPLDDDEAAILADEVPKLFESRPRAEWLAMLREADVCAVEHLHPCESFDQPQIRHNGLVVEVDDPVLGSVEQVGPPIRMAATPHVDARPAPRVGERGADVVSAWRAARREIAALDAASDDVALLDGVRILDAGAFYAGPYASRLLADLGADVIKVEPAVGDPLRGLRVVFRAAQANKRSLAVDLKAEPLARARERLLAWADVVHHNMRPGVAERLGLGASEVLASDPTTVYLYSPGWGSTGPDAARQSFAPKLSGFAGAGFEVAGRWNPPLFPVGNEDPGGGLTGAIAILLGLLHRQRTGAGQYVESPQINATLVGMSHIVRRTDGTVLGAGRLDPMQFGVSARERLYATSDGWICVSALTPRDSVALQTVLTSHAPRSAPAADIATVDDDDLADQLAAMFERRTTDEWLELLAEVGVPAVEPKAVHNAATFLRDPENHRARRAAAVQHATDGTVRAVDKLVRISGTYSPPYRLAPELGQHTDESLAWCGYAADEIAELRATGFVA